MKEWDLIIDDIPLDGSWNMAVEDFLFQPLTDKPKTTLHRRNRLMLISMTRNIFTHSPKI